MTKLFTGKTKDVYQLEDGNIKLVFKDDMTGTDGVFDPGANTVGLTVEGAGLAGLIMSVYYFKLLEKQGYPTHFISSEDNTMTVKQATPFGGSLQLKSEPHFRLRVGSDFECSGGGLEVICRYKAIGSFFRRYGGVIKEGTALDAVVEMTLKDDARGDPLINEDALTATGILKPGEYTEIKTLTKNICEVIKNDITEKGMELCDIKLEFGKDRRGKIILIDEISGGNMRVHESGHIISPLELSKRLVSAKI